MLSCININSSYRTAWTLDMPAYFLFKDIFDIQYNNVLQLNRQSEAAGVNTHKLIGLLALRQQRPLLLLLVLHEGLDVHVEAVAGGALGGLGGQLALLEQQRQQREQGVSAAPR